MRLFFLQFCDWFNIWSNYHFDQSAGSSHGVNGKACIWVPQIDNGNGMLRNEECPYYSWPCVILISRKHVDGRWGGEGVDGRRGKKVKIMARHAFDKCLKWTILYLLFLQTHTSVGISASIQLFIWIMPIISCCIDSKPYMPVLFVSSQNLPTSVSISNPFPRQKQYVPKTRLMMLAS